MKGAIFGEVKIALLAAALAALIPACAGPAPAPEAGAPKTDRPEFDRDMCGEHLSYEQGYNDGIQGRPMNSRFAVKCREDLRAASAKAYRSGFDAGKKDRQEGKKSTLESGEHSGTINIDIGGILNRGGGAPAPASAPAPNPKAYYCEVSAFMDKFSDFGPTQMETHKKVQDACIAQHHEMHCRDVMCKRNE